MKQLERAGYLSLIGVLLIMVWWSPGGETGNPSPPDKSILRTVPDKKPPPARVAGQDQPSPATQSDSGDPPRDPDTVRIPRALVAELRFFPFIPGTFDLSRERLNLAGLSDSQITGLETLYTQSISRLQAVEQSDAVVTDNGEGLLFTLPALDGAMSAEFDRSLSAIAGDDLASVIGPNLKGAESLNSFGELQRGFDIRLVRNPDGTPARADILFKKWSAEGDLIQSSSVSENFFRQRYPAFWERVAAKTGLPR